MSREHAVDPSRRDRDRFERPLEVLFVNVSVRRLAKGLVGVGIAMIASVVVTHPAALVFGGIVAALGGGIWHDVSRNKSHARARRALVRVDGDALVVDGHSVVSRADIREALFIPASPAGPLRLRLIGSRGAIAFEANVDDEAAAEDLLGALGVARRRSTFRGESRLARRAFLAILAVALGVALGGSFVLDRIMGARGVSAGPVVFALIVVAPLVASITSRIEIGDDGISVRWLFRRRFVPIHRILSATPRADNGLELELESGERRRLVFEARRNESRRTGARRRERDAALRRLHDAIARARNHSPALLGSRLARDGRDVGVWFEDLRRVSGATGFRASAISTDALWQVLEDSSVSDDGRAGAAVALLVADRDGGVRDRLRSLAENIASPRLRAAIRAAADAVRDDELAHVLLRLGR